MRYIPLSQQLYLDKADIKIITDEYTKCVEHGYAKMPYSLFTLLKRNETAVVSQKADGDRDYVFIIREEIIHVDAVSYSDFYLWFTRNFWDKRYCWLDVEPMAVTIISDTCCDSGTHIYSQAIGNSELKIDDNKKKEVDNMKGFNFDFGPVTGDVVRISTYGLAVKNQAGEWVSYNSATNEIFNVDLLNFDASKFVYKMPVAIKDVVVGDVIIHNKVAVFVTGIEDKVIVAIDPRSGEEKRVLLTRSPFGFDYCTKLVSFLTMFDNTATADNPFGGFLPFMLMGENDSIDPMAMLVMMQSQGNGTAMFSNPMMMYLLMKDSGNKDALLPLMMMSQMNK